MKKLVNFLLFISMSALGNSTELTLLLNPKSEVKLASDIESLGGRNFRYEDELVGYKGVLVENGDIYPLKIDIHGDLHAHWRGDNKSFKVRVKKNKSFRGMRNFSLIRFGDKYGNYEILGQLISKEFGLLHRKILSVDLRLKNDSVHKYIVYEKIIPDALEHNGLTGSFIISQNNIWKIALNKKSSLIRIPYINKNEMDTVHTLNPVMYKIRPKLNSNKVQKQWRKFLLNPSLHLIHTNHLTNFLALVALTGSIHSSLPDNLRWNYRPWSGVFSPIYYDTIPRVIMDEPKNFLAELGRMNFLLKQIILKLNHKDLISAIKLKVETLAVKIDDLLSKQPLAKKSDWHHQNIIKKNIHVIKKWEI